MGDWIEENNVLICEMKRRGMGCVYPALSVFGFLVALGAGLFFLVALDESELLSELMLPLLVLLFGLVFFFVGFSGGRMNFFSRVRIDREAGVLELSREKDRVAYRLPLGDVVRVALFQVRKSRGGSNSGSITTYQIFLERKDGAFFWLDTFYNKEKFQECVTLLATYTGFAVKDETGLGPDLDRQREYTDRFGDSSAYEPSRFVEISGAADGTRVKLRENKTFMDRLLMILVFSLFTAAPAYVLLSAVESSDGDVIFALFAVPFALIFFTIVVLVFVLTNKRYEILFRGSELIVELKFSMGWLTRLLGKTLKIPRTVIRAVRVNRLDEGHFWLSLACDPAFQEPAGGGLLFSLGAFGKPKARMPRSDEKIISLWEVPGYMKAGSGAGIADLLHIEEMLQRDLGVDESG